jgi:hypothetical protein
LSGVRQKQEEPWTVSSGGWLLEDRSRCMLEWEIRIVASTVLFLFVLRILLWVLKNLVKAGGRLGAKSVECVRKFGTARSNIRLYS